MKRLHGKVVCVTGAGRGLGRALAERFDAEGASLVLGARTMGEIDELARNLARAISVQTDVRVPADVEKLVDAAVAEFGQLDVMVNNAGVAVYGPLLSATVDDMRLMLETNVLGTLVGSQAALRVMAPRRTGHIVNIGSVAGKMFLPDESVYVASKWAITGFTGTLRLEAAAHGVKVTAVCPGGIDTPFWRSMDFHPFPDHVDPERDFMRPEEVAETVVQLVCTSSRYAVPEVVMVPMIPAPPR